MRFSRAKKEGSTCISDTLYHRIYPTSEEVPKFYGLPKIHKQGATLRPIVSSIGSITHKRAKFLAPVINPLLGKNQLAIKNSEDFVKKIKDLKVPQSRKLVLYDVTALYTTIPIEVAVAVIRGKPEQNTKLQGRCELSIDQITGG